MATGGEETITGGGDGGGAGEIVLFGVRVVVDSMRKSVSLNNLSQYEPPNAVSSSNLNDAAAGAVAAGYVSADDVVAHRSNNRERKRGIPWSEEEHKRFLIGLKKLGKGDWRGIAKNFVLTRTPTQVASHAQKYYIRRSNVSRRRRRSSLFDITTDSVVAVPTNNQQTTQDEASQSLSFVSTQTTSNRSQISTPPTVYPLAIGAPVDNRIDYKHFLPTQATPVPTTSPADYDIDMNSGFTASLSLNLSLSSSFDQGSSSSQQHSGFHIMSSPRASSIMGIA